jgi:hypothetical protein
MPVTRKPTDNSALQETLPNDPAFQRYLRKGGSAAHPNPDSEVKDIRFTLAIPGPLCREVDQLLEKLLPLKKSRHQWVLEAILEKVKRDQKAGADEYPVAKGAP